jgi:hypothetical protein
VSEVNQKKLRSSIKKFVNRLYYKIKCAKVQKVISVNSKKYIRLVDKGELILGGF